MQFYYKVILVDLGPNRLEVFAALRAYFSMTYGELRKYTADLPIELMSGVSRDEARLWIHRFGQLGALTDMQADLGGRDFSAETESEK